MGEKDKKDKTDEKRAEMVSRWTSGSMRGKKIEMAKKAGIALMFNAIKNKDKVGLITFGTDISERIAPTSDFVYLLQRISKKRAMKETNITKAISESLILFPIVLRKIHIPINSVMIKIPIIFLFISFLPPFVQFLSSKNRNYEKYIWSALI